MGLGAGVGGDAGADGRRFGGIEGIVLFRLLWSLLPLLDDDAAGLERSDTESLPAEDRGCAVVNCSDTLRGCISLATEISERC